MHLDLKRGETSARQSEGTSSEDSVPSLDTALQAAFLAEARLREAIEAMPQGIVFLDEEDRYILWNERYSQIYTKSADLLQRGAKLQDTLRIGIERGDYPDAIGQEEAWLSERLCHLHKPGSRHEQLLSDGRCIMIEERRLESGGTIGLRVDITELKQREDTFRLLFERNPLPMVVYNIETAQIRVANEAACQLFGYPLTQMNGLSAQALFPADKWEEGAEVLATDNSDTTDCWTMLHQDGGEIDIVIASRKFKLNNFSGTIISMIDVTERRIIEQQMIHMARHDELTDLANRAYSRQLLHDALEQTGTIPHITLALVDLDHFKQVNDTYGHHFGDLVLTEAAERMRQLIPADAHLCRIGGDEFSLILRQASRTQTEIISKSIVTSLSEPFFIQGHLIHIGATVGYALSLDAANDATTLMRYADLALYAAKGERRGTCRGFEQQMDTAAQEKSLLEKDLRAAVQKNQLEVYYQPIIDLQTGRTECYEALARWNHPTRGAIAPDIFIPLAEEIGIIDKIGRFVLSKACAEALNWPNHVRVCVNVSPIQFRNGNLLSMVINALSSSGLEAQRLELEITEAVLMEKGPRPAAIIRNLRNFGIGISLDDFGTGYSSLSYLLNYPFTKIKIDKSFILNLREEASSRAVIRAVIGLGRSLGLIVAAEGIEGVFERDYLRDEGCTQGQGYLFGKAQSSAHLSQ